MAGDIEYVVRGAKMKCTKGSHKRKINLPISHGSYIKKKPLMNKGDRVAGKNISYFGVCKVACAPIEIVSLVGEGGITVTGSKCCPMLISDWKKSKDDTLVDGKGALTTDSILICGRGGVIKFVTSGQEDS